MENTVQQLYLQVSQALSRVSETPFLDAQVLLSHFLEKPHSWLMAHPEASLNDQQTDKIYHALNRLQLGEPLPYVIARWEFYGLDFNLTPDVLIPRPETELLVERALDWLHHHPTSHKVIDVGTGSGCIGISLAAHNPNVHVLLTDISLPALKVAMANAEMHALSDRLEFQQADLLNGVTGSFDLLCANLPYIPRDALMRLPVADREPLLALDGGLRGLEITTRLLDQAREHVMPGGLMLLEIESSQGIEILKIGREYYPASKVQLLKDLAGHDRCVEITLTSLIVHLCQPEEWREAVDSGVYRADSLNSEGFIHCSRPDQLLQVGNRFYRGITQMKVLWIDPKKITAEIRWETVNGASFPHIYGPVDLASVSAVIDLQPDSDGYYRQFNLPVD